MGQPSKLRISDADDEEEKAEEELEEEKKDFLDSLLLLDSLLEFAPPSSVPSSGCFKTLMMYLGNDLQEAVHSAEFQQTVTSGPVLAVALSPVA